MDVSQQTIYIFSDGELKRQGNTLCLESDEKKRFIPVQTVREIMAFGEISVNKRVLEFLSQNEILLHYFSYYGYYMGTFYPRDHYNSGYMTLCQAQHYLDPDKRLALARSFVQGAGANIQRVLAYYEKRGKDLGEFRASITRLAEAVEEMPSVPELMAVEGNMRECYYQAFDTIIGDADFRFESRTRRPPQNRLNTLISFGNSLLYAATLSEIYKTHLDPRIGYLHSTNNRRFTLNLDVAEIFKPIVVDRLIFYLLGHRVIQADSFDSAREGIMLQDAARKRFVEAFDKRLAETIHHRELGRKVSYRELIRMELYKIQKHLMGDKPYQPFVALW
ncbi:MAG: type I-B CRISPR-associated endonuclease Cas1 [Firmicutes bacterium]|nr:type I-B CRISPR-associated endonuclease Cas1 [Bacillota bacterium]